MPEATTTTIAFRLSPSIVSQIEIVAKANDQSKSEWVRDQVMQALYAITRSNLQAELPQEHSANVSEVFETPIGAAVNMLRDEIATLKTLVQEVAKQQHDDLCTVVQVGVSVEESMEQRIEDARADLLDAIERVKQSQRSHKDTLHRAIDGQRPDERPNSRY